MRSALIAAVIVLTGWQGGQKPPAYGVEFLLPGDNPAYTGTTTFSVDAKGVVTGQMKIDVPTVVTATLTGAVKDGVWSFEYPYAMPDQGCEGTVRGTAKVPADRKVIAGNVTIGGACVQEPTAATFSFTLREK